MQKFSLFFLLIFFSFIGNTQKTFEGVITYSIKYQKIPAEMASVVSQLPTELVVKYQDSKKKEVVVSPRSSKITITDMISNKSFVLMTLFGEKIALIQDEENKKMRDLFSDCKVVLTKESKKIGNFKTQKALLYFSEIDTPIEIYFTDKYTISDSKFSNIDGLPLEFNTTENGMLITYTMVKIEEKTLKSKEFEVDENYKILTPEELQKQFGME